LSLDAVMPVVFEVVRSMPEPPSPFVTGVR
jgi:hypothetical protein